jgi:hypothetical protein
MALDTFISYSSKDKTAADAACAVLERAGIRCWIAPRDIRPGQEYGHSIIEAIDQCRVMVLIFSADANDSRQIHREIERAVTKAFRLSLCESKRSFQQSPWNISLVRSIGSTR